MSTLHNDYKQRLLSARQNPQFTQQALERVISAMGSLATSEQWQDVQRIVSRQLHPPPKELVCYCLGDLSEQSVAYQLAFFLLLANLFAIPSSSRLVFDPGKSLDIYSG